MVHDQLWFDCNEARHTSGRIITHAQFKVQFVTPVCAVMSETDWDTVYLRKKPMTAAQARSAKVSTFYERSLV
jgi:hypothetical protein